MNLDLIARSPCRGVNLPAVEHRDCHIVTADELFRLAEALGPELAPMAYLAAVLGLRWAVYAQELAPPSGLLPTNSEPSS